MQEIQETRLWFLGWENPLEEEMATHSGILAWKILGMEEPGRLKSTGLQRVGHDWALMHKLKPQKKTKNKNKKKHAQQRLWPSYFPCSFCLRTGPHVSWVTLQGTACPTSRKLKQTTDSLFNGSHLICQLHHTWKITKPWVHFKAVPAFTLGFFLL